MIGKTKVDTVRCCSGFSNRRLFRNYFVVTTMADLSKAFFHGAAASIMNYGYKSLKGLDIDTYIRGQYGGHLQYLTIQGLVRLLNRQWLASVKAFLYHHQIGTCMAYDGSESEPRRISFPSRCIPADLSLAGVIILSDFHIMQLCELSSATS